MTHQLYPLRPAMTAIAAVIALSTAPALAQNVEATPPIVDSAPATDPLAAEPTVTTTEPAASETAAAAAPAAKRATTRARPPAARARPTAARSPAVTRSVAATPAAATPIAEAATATLPPVPIAPEAAAVPLVAEPVAVEQPPVSSEAMAMDDALPIAWAVGLGLLALLGAGFVMRRRRRRADAALERAKWQHIQAAPEAVPETAFEPAPTFVRTPQADPVPVPVTEAAVAAHSGQVPDGFDTSGFGPHVQAAYRGPTPDNPSSSLKRRLTVGHFLDKKAEEAAPADSPITAEPAALKPAVAERSDADFMLRRSETKPGLRPAYPK